MFLEAGFEVFLNMTPDGPADLIVWDGSTTYLIDTKKIAVTVKADGTLGYTNCPSKSKRHPDVFYLGWCAQTGFVWLGNNAPEALLNLF